MRRAFDFTLIGLLGLSVQIVACAEGQNLPTGQGGSGNQGGDGGGNGGTGGDGGNTGGAGGSECSTEVCDGKDNDCNGQVDEGCECIPGQMEACYSGPAETNKVGTCSPGTHACDPQTNTWGPCTNEVLPAMELCNGLDDDCNGSPDDAIAEIVCGVGACMAAVPGCVNGMEGVCVPGQPSIEICDGLDNDCDQLTDESYPEKNKMCDSGIPGICATGTSNCVMGVLTCDPMNMPATEACDGLDNDCNGTVDDNIPGTGIACSTGQMGVCSMGMTACQNNAVDCYPITGPAPESCDGLDNDCNGMVDENNPGSGGTCMTGMSGGCALGTEQCMAGALICRPNNLGQPELCNGMDDDCDGVADDGNPGNGLTCTCGGTSTCMAGTLVCSGCTREVNCNDGQNEDGDNKTDCMDGDCALGCSAMINPCAAGEKLLVATSADVPKPIPDAGNVTSTIVFTEPLTVKRVVLQVDVTHTFDKDVDLRLISPANSSVLMTDGNGNVGNNYTNTIFHDGCATSITTGMAPFSNCYIPEQALSAFVNQTVAGTWTLRAADLATFDTGTLNSWTLAICAQ